MCKSAKYLSVRVRAHILLEGHVRGWARRGWGQGEGRGKRGGEREGEADQKAPRTFLLVLMQGEQTRLGSARLLHVHRLRAHRLGPPQDDARPCLQIPSHHGRFPNLSTVLHSVWNGIRLQHTRPCNPCFVRNSSRGAAWSPIRRGLCTTSWMMAQEEVRSQRSGRAPAGCSHRSARRPPGQISGPAPPQGRPAPDAPAGPPSPFQLASLPAPIGTRLPFSRTDGAHISHMRSSDHRTECSYPFQ